MSGIPEWLRSYSDFCERMRERLEEEGPYEDLLEEMSVLSPLYMFHQSIEFCFDMVAQGVSTEQEELLMEFLGNQEALMKMSHGALLDAIELKSVNDQRLIDLANKASKGGSKGIHKDKWDQGWANLFSEDEWKLFSSKYAPIAGSKGSNRDSLVGKFVEDVYNQLRARFADQVNDYELDLKKTSKTEWIAIKRLIKERLSQ